MGDKPIEQVLAEAPRPDRHHRVDAWFYGRSARAMKLRSRRVRPLVKRTLDRCPWITQSDITTLRAWADLEILGAACMAELLETGVLDGKKQPKSLIDQLRRIRSTQLQYARELGLSPAARMAIRESGSNAAVDLALAAQRRADTEVTDADAELVSG